MKAKQLFAEPIDVAFNLARQHRLIGDDGTIVCWNCGDQEALLPSLHCLPCLAAARRRLGIPLPHAENRAQTDTDRERALRP